MTDEATAEETLGTRLKALREAAGLSRRALASLAGANDQAIGLWERGRRVPQASSVRRLAEALGVPPDALTGGRPKAEDLPAGLRAALVASGVWPGPAGYDAAVLVAATEVRGWRSTVEELAPSRGGRFRYQAMVFGSIGGNSPSHASGRARGATEAEALAKALVRLLERTG